MRKSTFYATLGGLLHDVGKIMYRKGGDERNHSIQGYEYLKDIVGDRNILDCVRYHHGRELSSANIAKDSPAYAVYIADNIASGADRRCENNSINGRKYDCMMPLTSVFGTMQGKENAFAYKAQVLDGKNIVYPSEKNSVVNTREDYSKIAELLSHELRSISYTEEYVNSALSIMEHCTSYIPSTTDTSQVQDISLFDHSKLTSAFAACINEYCAEHGIDNMKSALFKNANDSYGEKMFLMYSCDISGIQNFIYSISTDGALKSLRSRSFFIELLMEHYIDEVLDCCGLSRANLIYSGGGHCFLILPNTEKTVEMCEKNKRAMHGWLIENFGTALYLASAYVECSANDLMNIPKSKAPYKEIYVRLSSKIAAEKLHRYSADEIRKLNSLNNGGGTRECKICGRSDNLNPEGFCASCSMFIKMGSRLIDENLKIAVTKNRPAEENIISCEMPSANGNVFMSFINEKNDHDDEIKNFIRTHDDIIRIYSKNKAYTGLKYARNIYMGDYCYNSSLSEMAEDMGKDHEGIRRLAVLRSDVDNLGKAFISGFENISSNDPEIRYKNVTISRTASFSRQMSMFFRYFINLVLEGRSGISGLSLSDKSVVKKKVNIVYSGGDDVLLIGYWSDVIEAAANIRDVFEKYCSNALTVSSGIGIFTVKYPVSAEARITGELVDKAKEYVSASGKEKDALDLFSPEDGYVFSWDEFKQKVIEEKYRCIAQLFNYRMNRTGEDIMRGNAMLYKLLKLLRGAGEKINIARYAYMLTRLEPDRKNEEYFMIYKDFSKNMYRWILNKADRKELIAAIYIYVYITRNWEADKNGNYANCV